MRIHHSVAHWSRAYGIRFVFAEHVFRIIIDWGRHGVTIHIREDEENY